MSRRRVAVAILATGDRAAGVDLLRRSIGVPEPFRVPPHITLVSPVNIHDQELDRIRTLIRSAATAVDPFSLRIGPAATFAPESPTLHLAVAGIDSSLTSLADLRERLRSGPFDREDMWPFTPHVTLAEGYPPDRIQAGMEVLSSVRATWPVTAVHLLEQRRHAEGTPQWVPVMEEPLGGPGLVGRGGLELLVRTAGMVEESVADLCGVDPVPPWTPGGTATVAAVVAEERGVPGVAVGAAVGEVRGGPAGGVSRLLSVRVQEGHRGLGIGGQVLTRWCAATAGCGADVAIARDDEVDDGFLRRHGFAASGRWLLRQL